MKWILIMTNTIKLFESTMNFYETLGVYPSQLNRNYFFDLKFPFILISLISAFIATAAFFLFEANSITEHIETFYAALTTLGCAGCLLINRYKTETILQLKQKAEDLIQKSEFLKFKANEYWFSTYRFWLVAFFVIMIFFTNFELWSLFYFNFLSLISENDTIACLKYVHLYSNKKNSVHLFFYLSFRIIILFSMQSYWFRKMKTKWLKFERLVVVR